MKKLESSFRNMVFILSVISIFAAVTIGAVYTLTKQSIDNLQRNKRYEAIEGVLPVHDHFDSIPVELNNGIETTKVYKAYDKNNALVGAAVESSSNNGYKGHIDIIVGFNLKGIIVNYFVLDQHETPGLGARMESWFKTGNTKADIRGKNAATANLNVSKDGGEVDAITAATISSRAFLFAVRNAYFSFTSNFENHPDIPKSKADSTGQSVNDTTPRSTIDKMKGQQP
jgi:electron transport complex protein RnfG